MKKLLMILVVLICFVNLDAKPKEVVCIGDSITQGFGIPDAQRAEFSFPSVLGKLLGKKYKVINLGCCSRTLLKNSGLSWNGGAEGQFKKTKPAIVIIMLGTNDSKLKHWKGNADQFEKDLQELLKLVHKVGRRAKVFVCLPPPSFSGKELSKGDGISGERIKEEIIPIIEKVVKKHKEVTLIDVFSAMREHPDYFADGVHPNIKGADYLAKFLYKEIKPALK